MTSKLSFALLPAFLIAASSTACSGGDDDSGGTSAGSGGTGASSGGTGAGSGGTMSASGGSNAGAGAGGSSAGMGASGSGGAAAGMGGAAAGMGGAAAGMGGAAGGNACGSNMLKLDATSNYTFASNITLIPTKVKANEPNLTFDWSGVTTDFLGRATSPTADIDSVMLVELSATLDQFEKVLNDDDPVELRQLVQGPLQRITMNTLTSSSLEDFGVVGQPENTYKTSSDVKAATDDYLDPTKFDPSMHMFAVMPAKGTQAGTGTRMIQVFTVDANTTTTTLMLSANTVVAPRSNGHTGGTTGPSMSVTYDANLQSLTPIKVAAGNPNLTIDWSGLTKNALGRDWQKRYLYRMVVGHYTQSLTDLENQFFNLETIASTLYSQDIPSDDPLSLSGMKEKTSGAAFTGIDNTGVWIMALFCDPMECGNPAPWFLTVLQTCN
jgi:hypothetical protein